MAIDETNKAASKAVSPVMLVILDGFGIAPAGAGNAVDLASTPNMDKYQATYPHAQLQASGEAVGLPAGQMGNSEVGHMNIGAGRIVMQSLSYLKHQIETGDFFTNEILTKLYDQANQANGHALHLLGLVSDGGVHSHLEHLLALCKLAKERNIAPVYIHVFTDGRDTAPDSALGFVAELEAGIAALEHDIKIASVSGRYYAMDRDNRWNRISQAYDTIVCANSMYSATSATFAIQDAYERGETDEFIQPTVIIDNNGEPLATMQDGDSVFCFNFRADRMRQIVQALLAGKTTDFTSFERCAMPELHMASMMHYDDDFTNLPAAFALPEVNDCLAEVISRADKTQFHTAETEKYPHVTYFFNAKKEQPFAGETRNLIPSPKVATYDLQPEMSEPELARATLERLQDFADDFVLINFANPDMVGHTGDLEAAIKACEAADEGLGQLVDAVLSKDGAVIIIADHGNAEKMLTEAGEPHTAHTTNPVPCVLVSNRPELQKQAVRLEPGILGNIAPTVLELLDIPKPAAMTQNSLIVRLSETGE